MEGILLRYGYINGHVVPSLDALVCALCADYKRREEVILSGEISVRTSAELRYLNYKIKNAVSEVTEGYGIETFITEIGSRRGYANSEIEGMGEVLYKQKKLQIKENIAKTLHLCD